jgi:predicted TIM-barrel fold metal-dependent hydrolase
MSPVFLAAIVLVTFTEKAAGQPPAPPRADHHAHLVSPSSRAALSRAGFPDRVITADALIRGLDSAGIRQAAVLSLAYVFGQPEIRAAALSDEYRQVRTENDWVAREVASHADRLVGFCSVNPLRDYATAEVRRCARIGLRGLKLHLTNSAVDLRDENHLTLLRRVFASANEAGLPIVIHLRTRAPDFGAVDARVLIERVLPTAPDVPIQVAHLAGWGGFDAGTDGALGAFVAAMEAGALSRDHLFFELSAVVVPGDGGPPESPIRILSDLARAYPDGPGRLARRIRAVGLDRILFGTDSPFFSPASYPAVLRDGLALDSVEVARIFGNVAPYFASGDAHSSRQ